MGHSRSPRCPWASTASRKSVRRPVQVHKGALRYEHPWMQRPPIASVAVLRRRDIKLVTA